ncbi:MAG: hypothetical protein K5840_02170 [Eubacterium sp.]|nr:hypothetical protein [Eubacterium sp.]
MDRAEYREKLQSIKDLGRRGKYKDAAEIIEEINWKRVKSASTLTHVGIILGKAGRYDEAREVLLDAYDRAPIGRTSVYWLTEFEIRQAHREDAEAYFREYVEIAPDDSRRYELEYKIKRMNGESVDSRIESLEKLREAEFTEQWSYELAYMYHKAGRSQDCIDLCDKIILYFGEGYYVEKALELKVLYEPLQGVQAEKYEELKLKRDGVTKVRPGDESAYAEILHKDVYIPRVNESATMINTIDLQKEIARNIQQIKEATEKEEVDSTLEGIRQLARDNNIPIPEPTKEDDEKLCEEMNIESAEDIDASLDINFREMIGVEDGGQMSISIPERPTVEEQVPGQLTIGDVLAEWEKTKEAARSTMENARIRKLESAKAVAIARSEDIMDTIADVAKQQEEAEAARE